MVCFTKLAFTIAIAFKPICAIEMPKQAEINQDWFEELVRMIPNDKVRNSLMDLYASENYVDLENNLLEYLDEYVENSSVGEERVDIDRKKANIMNEIIGFIDKKVNTGDSEEIDSFEDENKDKSNEERAIIKFHEIINEDLFPGQMEGAKKLLKDKDYSKLEDFILNNINYENDDGGDALNKLSGAMDLARGFSEQDTSLFEESEVMMATNPPEAQVANATNTIKTLIEEYVAGDKKEKAKALLEKKDYDALENFVLDNLDQSELTNFGDEKSTNMLNTLARAMDVLHASAMPASSTTVSNPVSNSTNLRQ